MKIKEPIKINNLVLKNRLIMAPAASERATEQGMVTQEQINYYNKMSSAGQISLFIIEHSHVSPEGKASPRQISVAADEAINGLKKIVKVVHENGSKAVLQISHAGSMARKEVTGTEPIAPSPIMNPRRENDIPLEMTLEDIKRLIQDYIEAACRAQAAGFDGVEIHSAHGYMLNQFFSPLTNKRTDHYGGSIENRVRIHLEIIEGIRKSLGRDYPIFLRLGASDRHPDGATIEDSVKAARMFQDAGIDALDVSGGFCGYTGEGQGYFKDLTRPLKEALDIPVILTGGITEISMAESLLAEGDADIIGVARILLKDNAWGAEDLL